MAGEREIERKYSVDPRFVLPRLTDLPGVATARARRAVTLEAIYYDTDDLRLARNKITLRRRTGGSDAGWHLKLPVGGDEREEIRRPLEQVGTSGRRSGRAATAAKSARGGKAGRAGKAVAAASTAAVPVPAGAADSVPADSLPADSVPTGSAPSESPLNGVEPAGARLVGAGSDGVAADATRVPPADLVDLVTARLRGAELRPVARVVTLRTARRLRDAEGRDLAEVVDDQVSAQTLGEVTTIQKWREIEVELADGLAEGEESILDEVEAMFLAAGASRASVPSKLARVLGDRLEQLPGPDLPPRPARLRRRTPAGEVIRAYLVAQVDALLTTDPRVRMDAEDSVHKMRVACRRIRSTLRTFAPFFPADLAAHLDGELRDLAGALSGARDFEVQIEYFSGRLAGLPDDLVRGPVAETISGQLGTGRAAGRDEALAMLRGERYVRLLSELLALVNGPLLGRAGQPAGKVLPGMVQAADRQLARKVKKAAKLPAGRERDERLHSARKQAKRLRYAAEAVTPVYGSDAAAFARLAEELQELLGAHQDACVARSLLREWGLAAQSAGEPTAFTLGLLLGLEDCRAGAAEREFFDAWPRLSASRHRRWLG